MDDGVDGAGGSWTEAELCWELCCELCWAICEAAAVAAALSTKRNIHLNLSCILYQSHEVHVQ